MKKRFDFSYQQSVEKWTLMEVNYPLYNIMYI